MTALLGYRPDTAFVTEPFITTKQTLWYFTSWYASSKPSSVGCLPNPFVIADDHISKGFITHVLPNDNMISSTNETELKVGIIRNVSLLKLFHPTSLISSLCYLTAAFLGKRSMLEDGANGESESSRTVQPVTICTRNLYVRVKHTKSILQSLRRLV